tara:strand:- start:265 stop:417 length:153 start_codon:yes stop_codon:yes gene_type:complete
MPGLSQALGYMNGGALIGTRDNLSAVGISRHDLEGPTEVRRLLNGYVEKV